MNIVVVEDDHLQAEDLREELSLGLPTIQIQIYSSVSSVLSDFRKFELDPPVFIILDLMLRWRSPWEQESPVPEDFDGPDMGGIFLARKLRTIEALRKTPIVLWSVVDFSLPESLKQDLTIIVFSKSQYSDEDMRDRIRSVLIARGVDFPETDSRARSLADSINVRLGAFGISVDLKKAIKALKPKKKHGN